MSSRHVDGDAGPNLNLTTVLPHVYVHYMLCVDIPRRLHAQFFTYVNIIPCRGNGHDRRVVPGGGGGDLTDDAH